MTFHPGEHAKCPARVHRGNGTQRCGRDLELLAGPQTAIKVRIVALKPEPGEAVQYCRRCGTMLAIRLEALA